jgi:exosortase/archaeosortase family protein
MTASLPATQVRAPPAKRLALRYVARFVGIAGVLLATYYFPYDPRGLASALLRAYLASYAHLAGAVLALLDPSVHVHGADIVGRYSLTFAMNCDAMDVYILFASALLAFPAGARARALGLAAGLAALVALNVVRIVSLYFVGVYFPRAFEFCHMDAWPMVIVLATCAGFLLWTRWNRAVFVGAADAGAQV